MAGFAVPRAGPPIWLDDYFAAKEQAQAAGRMLLLWFFDPPAGESNARLEREVFEQPGIGDLLAGRFVAARLPTDARFVRDGRQLRLLDEDAFGHLGGRAGLAVIDLTDRQSLHFGQLVSVYPFVRETITMDHLAVLLQLPHGTLTQRTMLLAVRTHPERPASADGHLSLLLSGASESHAQHQAAIRQQGHHNWERRFHELNAQLPGGLVAQEVCAESWPGQGLVEAAEECVASWRQSPGHWAAVSARHVLFGYDMKRGSNGVWYAVGIFARRLQ